MIYTWDDRYVCLDSHLFGGNLVSHGVHNVAGRSDKCDAVSFAGIYKIRVFGKESVTGMNCIYTGIKGDFDNGINIQICIDWSFILT